MRQRPWVKASLLLVMFALPGCYLTHERDERDIVDAASTPDGGGGHCDRLGVTAMTTLTDALAPRLVAIPGGDVGVAHFAGSADGTLHYARFDAALTRASARTILANDDFDELSITNGEGELWVGYGHGGSSAAFLRIDFDGRPIAPPSALALPGPDVLTPVATGRVIWGGDLDGINMQLAAIDGASGTITGETRLLHLGAYTDGHRAMTLADGRVLLVYPELDVGAFARFVEADGTLEPAHRLDAPLPFSSVWPIEIGGRVLVVSRAPPTNVITELDADPNGAIVILGVHEAPRRDGPPLVGAFRDRLVLADAFEGVLTWDWYDTALVSTVRGSAGDLLDEVSSVLVTDQALYLAGTRAAMGTPQARIVALGCAD